MTASGVRKQNVIGGEITDLMSLGAMMMLPYKLNSTAESFFKTRHAPSTPVQAVETHRAGQYPDSALPSLTNDVAPAQGELDSQARALATVSRMRRIPWVTVYQPVVLIMYSDLDACRSTGSSAVHGLCRSGDARQYECQNRLA